MELYHIKGRQSQRAADGDSDAQGPEVVGVAA